MGALGRFGFVLVDRLGYFFYESELARVCEGGIYFLMLEKVRFLRKIVRKDVW